MKSVDVCRPTKYKKDWLTSESELWKHNSPGRCHSACPGGMQAVRSDVLDMGTHHPCGVLGLVRCCNTTRGHKGSQHSEDTLGQEGKIADERF